MGERIYNFSAGPAVLPEPVLEEAQRDLLALPDAGMSVLEISHRSRHFDAILAEAERALRDLAGVPASHRVLFLQGGASLQFAMVPMNLLPAGGTADYLVTGVWSRKAVKEAERIGRVHPAASTESERFVRVPRADEIAVSPDAAYVHMTSNNTIYGTQWTNLPETGSSPLVSDMCSDIFSRPVPVERFGLIYAGAQKNLGPAGLTVVIVDEALLARSPDVLPSMLSYRVLADGGSRYNTPPVFAIYLLGLVLKWLAAQGGLEVMAAHNDRQAARLYAEVDRTGFYRGVAERESRSRMNVTFRLPTTDLDGRFAREAAEVGLDGLAGHRTVGGLRASIYNAMPDAGVAALVEFMQEFERTHG
ncbi:MAG: 3-phosphoserine/phosphohydroxythreonine transaminase [Vicinamibacterales bacterium]|jgi:phosphoserine aminotransferase|nr:3-phosphoserine/phosphohydroxythreonine aminotransferase [Acidobacteriota bacterium]MDP6371945.1 3-phosphoserine/phosphohydroxythreonine transaminase [Vicinamibacterales bacterium]MDP6607720.1 3-phosphoserine/phosphohydroxythreonine transaminase [Vicinamibacterales bacterium]HAK55801.1 3-phosphoserine/phosphohydroxythreonine transaminase [Acidobacteriota bacterium]|tara:strand:+ start:10783 stop:11868 length:1086 start_codon:yes stop_codon:yes gene_type:complete